jgi:hypothetical protein
MSMVAGKRAWAPSTASRDQSERRPARGGGGGAGSEASA